MTVMSWILRLFLLAAAILHVASQLPKRDSDTLDDSFWNEETFVGDVEKLLEVHKENQDLVRSIGSSQYQIVYPVQLRQHEKMGISTREIGASKQQTGKHYHRTSLLIKAFSHKFRLDLELNTQLLAPNLIQKHFLPGGVEQFSKQEIEHCYYHGTVKDYPGAVAAFRTCSGVSGIIHIGNETFVIHPFYGGDLSRKHPHVIFEARAKLKQMCSNHGNIEWGLRSYRKNKNTKSLVSERYKRDVREVTKYVETALVLDKAMFEKRNESKRIEVIQDAIQIANIADLYFRTINTRVSVVYIETWASGNQVQIDTSQDIHRSLLNFNDYMSRKLFNIGRDTIQLLSGESFPNGVSGMAIPGTICTPKSVAISVDLNPYEPHLVAGTMAHMIGHNMGMGHDDERGDCNCADWHGCIMSHSIVGSDNIQPYKFSDCSLSDYIDRLRIGHAICLFNRPNQMEDLRKCGNGIVDEGEECDCGTIDECDDSDPCCDSITCKLKAEAECGFGPCCDDCKLRQKDYVCREATNECDLPEFCTGHSGQCPTNIYKKNGVACESNKGYCFSGYCPTLDSQCRLIWGDGGLSGDRKCFEQFNSQGSINGHCGVDNNVYTKCEPENVMCGSLQCQMGTRHPIVEGMDQMYSRTLVSIGGREFECKITSGTMAAADLPDIGIVRDGTPCGNNLICFNKTCTSIYPFIDRVKCPSNNLALDCSGHGVCSNINTCFCDPGWTGHDCSTQTNITHPTYSPRTAVPSSTPPSTTTTTEAASQTNSNKPGTYVYRDGHSTVLMVVMLVSVVGGVFIVFALMALCYRSVVVHRNLSLCLRRKSAMPKYDPPYLKRPLVNAPLPAKPGVANHTVATPMSISGDTLSLEAGAKGITFGTMPSYSRFPREHKVQYMKRQADGATGSPVHMGSPNAVPGHLNNQIISASEDETLQSGEDEATAFLDGPPNNLSKQPEKGILKKSGGIYGPVGGMGSHSASLTLPLGLPTSSKEKWSEESQSDNQEVMSVLMSPDGDRSDRIGGPSSLSDVERTLKSLNGYHEDILQALRSAAASQRSASTASLSDELRKSFADSYSDYFPPTEYLSMRGMGSHDKLGRGLGSSSSNSERVTGMTSPMPGTGLIADSGDEGDLVPPCGPIRIRNLEDLIRQLERHSARHTSPNGSEDIRMSETEADRHYRLMEAAGGVSGSTSDSQPGDALRFVYGRYRQPSSVPGISLYESTNENDKGDTGDSDESDRCFGLY